MDQVIKAIETNYRGHRMRSRLEARWSVFFDALGIKWEYEPEGYNLGSAGLYLPDFYLPQVHMFAEVKPKWPTQAEMGKITSLAKHTSTSVLILDGQPDFKNYWAAEYTDQCSFPGEQVGHYFMDYIIDEGSCYWLDEGRFYSCTGLGPFERQDTTEHSNHNGVLASRSARFEFGESGAAV